MDFMILIFSMLSSMILNVFGYLIINNKKVIEAAKFIQIFKVINN